MLNFGNRPDIFGQDCRFALAAGELWPLQKIVCYLLHIFYT